MAADRMQQARMALVDGTCLRFDIQATVRKVAVSIQRSFEAYWPADEYGKNDPKEANLSLHLAHVLLEDRFFVFAEANHPCHQGLDILAISPCKDFYIACEVKRHKQRELADSLNDLDRVCSFTLNNRLRPGRVGECTIDTVRKCVRGIGVVAGLKWIGPKAPYRVREESEFAKRVQQLGGKVGEPEHVISWRCSEAPGSYVLQYACIPLQQSVSFERVP